MSPASATAAVDTRAGIAEPVTPWCTGHRSTRTARHSKGLRQCGFPPAATAKSPTDGGPKLPRRQKPLGLDAVTGGDAFVTAGVASGVVVVVAVCPTVIGPPMGVPVCC